MPILFRDYETRSTLDLCKVGAWRYACDPSTGMWRCAFAVDAQQIPRVFCDSHTRARRAPPQEEVRAHAW